MKSASLCLMMLALTACGNGDDHPPVNTTIPNDASIEAAVDAGTDAPLQDVGTGDATDAPADAPTDALGEASDAPTDAIEAEAAAPIAMCCTYEGVTNLCPEADAGAVFCASNYCTVNNNVVGTLAACPICNGVITDPTCGSDASDAAAPLTCDMTSVANSGGLICVCPAGTTCHYGGNDHCSAKCL
jgi:hypothetical protein